MIITINDTSLGYLPLIINISDACKNHPKSLDFDNTINLSSLIVIQWVCDNQWTYVGEGENLMMSGTDRLGGDTDTLTVSQQGMISMLPVHPGQARELLHVLLPPHQRVCVKGHLLHSRVGIQLGLHTVDIDIHGCTAT